MQTKPSITGGAGWLLDHPELKAAESDRNGWRALDNIAARLCSRWLILLIKMAAWHPTMAETCIFWAKFEWFAKMSQTANKVLVYAQR